jgi:glycosyltransferase involved in cell wall biosynthesis
MKLLLVHNYYAQDGGEDAVFRHLAALLERRGHRVLRYERHNEDLARTGAVERLGVVAGGFHSRRTAREIGALVARERPDAALVQNVFPLVSPSVYTALRAAGVPTVQLVYNYRLICPNAHLYTRGAICERCVTGSLWNAVRYSCYRTRLESAWYAAILASHRGTFAALDGFVVPDGFMRGKLVEGGMPEDRIVPVGNPFDLAGYAPVPDQGDYYLFVGRLVRQKGILTLVRAFARLDAPVRLLVVGDGPERGEAEALAQALCAGRVEFLGLRWGDEVRALIARSLAVCIPSEWYDNAPLLLYQAYALGRPVVASRIDGIPEVVAHGQDGLLAGPGDVDDWTARLRELWQDPALRDRLGRAARAKAEAQFSEDAYYGRLQAALERLLPRAS